MREKRTPVDFSKHILDEYEFGDKMKTYRLQRPDTITQSITLINTHGLLVVTGDYGNWVFCREFHPSASDEGVSDGYWCEKLQIHSVQDPYVFDAKAAQEEIKNLLQEDEDHNISEEEREWLEELSAEADEGEYAYIAKAMDRPSSFEAELIPKGKVFNAHLEVVFDAFDEICRRMKTYKAAGMSRHDAIETSRTYYLPKEE